MSSYHARLDGPRWAATRLRALAGAGWRCGRCGRAGALEVHHKRPLHHGGAPYDPANLEVVCRACHIDVHRRPLTEAEAAWRRLVESLL